MASWASIRVAAHSIVCGVRRRLPPPSFRFVAARDSEWQRVAACDSVWQRVAAYSGVRVMRLRPRFGVCLVRANDDAANKWSGRALRCAAGSHRRHCCLSLCLHRS